jgi:hypothetical protein
MKRFTLAVFVLGLAMGLVCCAGKKTNAPVTSAWDFTPPSGWKPVLRNGAELGVQEWRGTDPSQLVSFVAYQHPDSAGVALPANLVDRVLSQEQLCNDLPATLFKLRPTEGSQLTGEAMAMQWHDMRGVATYFHRIADKPNPVAEASLKTICPKS